MMSCHWVPTLTPSCPQSSVYRQLEVWQTGSESQEPRVQPSPFAGPGAFSCKMVVLMLHLPRQREALLLSGLMRVLEGLHGPFVVR